MEKMKKELFNTAMKGDWKRVEATYRADTRAHTAKITRSGETALHVAVSDWQEGVVEDIVRHVAEAGTATAALRTENERGNTALHLAAAMGNVRMCRCIAGADASLVGARNCDSETPLFLAALRGKKEAFLALHFMSPSSSRNDASFCRRKNGQTALHCSIAGEYFDLAFHIIQLYGELVNSVDQHGHTPLHVLASTFVDELEVEKDDPTQMMKKLKQEEESANYPPTYKICVNLFQLLRRSVIAVTLRARTPQIGADTENPSSEQPSKPQNLFPPNYSTCFNFFKIVCKALLVILGFGSGMIMKIRQKKEKHVWSVQVMNELLKRASMYEYENTGADPWAVQSTRSHKEDGETNPYEIVNRSDPTFPADQPFTEATNSSKTGNNGTVTGSNKAWLGEETKESAILIAAKNGVKEMVERILEMFPVAIHDVNWQKKNVVLLAVEHRQPHVFRSLLRRNILTDNIFQQVDSHGNSALHLAAMLGDYKPWLIPGSALQMQWEIKWYEFVKKSMPPNFFVRYNDERKTAKEIFTETHAGMVKAGGEWLTHTSESCSVVAALIATVAFATSTTFPGGTDDSSGRPKLEDRPAFELFAIASLVALCFSVTAVIMFLAILTSRYQEKDFGRDLPRKLLIGLTSLFVSIASMLVSFCAGHFFVLHHKLKYAAFPMYAVTCLPVSFFALAQFPLYFDLIWASFKKVPQRSYKVALSAP